MADPISALFQALNEDRQEAYATNPWIRGAAGIAQAPMDMSGLSGPERFALQALQGFGSGLSAGYGKAQADDEYRQIASPILDALSDSSKIPALAESPDTAEYAPYLKAYEIQRNNERLDKLQDRYLANDMYFDPSTGPRELPGVAESKIAFEREKQGIADEAPAKKEGQLEALRKEFHALIPVRAYEQSLIGIRSLREAAKDPSATSDIELVRGAIQAIEPGMAVREGEALEARKADSLFGSLGGTVNKVLMGESALSPEARAGIMRIAERRFNSYGQQFNLAREGYLEQAQRMGLPNPERFTYLQPVPIGIPQQQAAAPAPAINPAADPGAPSAAPAGVGSSSMLEMAKQFPNTPEGREQFRRALAAQNAPAQQDTNAEMSKRFGRY